MRLRWMVSRSGYGSLRVSVSEAETPPYAVVRMVNLSPDVLSATTSPQSPTRTSTHETFSRRKSSKAPPMNDATAASTRGASSAPVPTMWMYTWFQAVPCCPTASSIDPSTSARTESSSTPLVPDASVGVWPSRATSTATEPLGVRWCPTPPAPVEAVEAASSSSFWYTDARRNASVALRELRALPGLGHGLLRQEHADGVLTGRHEVRRAPAAVRARRDLAHALHLEVGQALNLHLRRDVRPEAPRQPHLLELPVGLQRRPSDLAAGPNDRRRGGGFCGWPAGDVAEAVGDAGADGPAAEPGSVSAAPTRAKVKCCGAAPTASSDTATRLVLGEMAPARFCPLTNALADSRTSRSSRPCRRG